MNVFELVGSFAVKGLDEAEAGIKATTATAKSGFGDMEAAAEGSSGKLSGLASKLGGGLATAAKVGAAALVATATAASVALGGVASKALDAYASYEQLTGGVETLFAESAGTVEAYAANAYQTAGMSANAYMETVTSFSASLLQGLGGDTAAAAEYANKAVTDMSDNANKMGTSISSIQDAYQGFAKQNYTMLDNLKLGYGGTQSEMARLINDSGVLGDSMEVTAETVNEVSFDQMIEAIHVVQTEMGITGTTALEASTTIEGSVNSAKAAWENWLTGLADDNADVSALTTQLVDSVATAAGNIVPRIVQILATLAQQLATQLPAIIDQLIAACQAYGPQLLQAAITLFGAIVQALIENGPVVIQALLGLIMQLADYLAANMPAMVDGAFALFGGILSALAQASPQILAALVAVLVSLVAAVAGKVGEMIAGGIELLGGLLGGMGSVDVDGFVAGVIAGITGAFSGAGSWLVNAGWQLLQGLWSGIQSGLGWLGDQLAGIGDFIVQHKGPPAEDAVMLEGNGRLITAGLVRGIRAGVPLLRAALADMSSEISGSDLSATVATRAVSTSVAPSQTGGVQAAAGAEVLALLKSILRAIEDKDLDVLLDGDSVVAKTSKRMERSIARRNALTGGIA